MTKIKLTRKNEGFSPDAIKRFTVDDPNYVKHVVIPDKKNGDDVIVKIIRGTHPLFSGTVYYGRALRSSAKEPFSTGMGSLELMTSWLDNLTKHGPEVALAKLANLEASANESKTDAGVNEIMDIEFDNPPFKARAYEDEYIEYVIYALDDSGEEDSAIRGPHTNRALAEGIVQDLIEDFPGEYFHVVAILRDGKDRLMDSEVVWSNYPDNESKTNESIGAVTRNSDRYKEALSPKLALRSKLSRVDNYLKGLYVFNSVIGRSAKDLHDKGFNLDMGCGDKGDCETEAKKALSDFDDYVEYNIVSEMENGKPYWYVDIKFKPEFWELGDSELGEVLTLLNGAIEEYA